MTTVPLALVQVLLMAFLAACSSPKVSEAPAAEFASEGLHPVKASGFESAYVHPEARVSSYEVLTVEAMDVAGVEVTQTTVSATTRQSWQMTSEREERLRDAWASATERAFSDYDLSGDGDHVLVVRSALTRISPSRMATTSTTVSGAAVRGTGDVVDAYAEFRLYDQASGQLLAVIRDRRAIASLQWSRAAGADMVNLFNSWAGLLHTRVSGR